MKPDTFRRWREQEEEVVCRRAHLAAVARVGVADLLDEVEDEPGR